MQKHIAPNGALNLLSVILTAAAVIVLLAPLTFAGSLHYPNMQVLALQLLSSFALLGAGFFSSVAAAGKNAIKAGNALSNQPGCGTAGNAPARRAPACAANPLTTAPAHTTPA